MGLKKLFPKAIRFLELTTQHLPSANRVLIIDSIGILSRLYHYAYITYVGGGFTKDGVHNVLEAAVYGKPVLFGNNYKKYKEAIDYYLLSYSLAGSLGALNEKKEAAKCKHIIMDFSCFVYDVMQNREMV